MSSTQMTVGQALVAFLSHQYTVDGDRRVRTIPAVFGIFGHGQVAGFGQGILQQQRTDPHVLPYHQGRNEQGEVHQAIGFARQTRRLQTFAVTASTGPGSTNMLTGAAVATTNHLPALLLPADMFATRSPDPALQQLEQPYGGDLSVNDAFRPLSRFFDRVSRPEQLISALLNAFRVLTDPAETGAVTISLPQDVQAQSLWVPDEFLKDREWRIRRPDPETEDIAAAVTAIRGARKPLIISGGGTLYAFAEELLQTFAEATGIPVAFTQAGTGALNWDHPLNLGAIGHTGTQAANTYAREADLVIGIGTRYEDFTTASRTLFQAPDVSFVNINIAAFDAYKMGTSIPIVADAGKALAALTAGLDSYHTADSLAEEISGLKSMWDALVDDAYETRFAPLPAQAEIIGAVNEAAGETGIVVCAAGSLPGDLHKLWRSRNSYSYHVEYAYSTMGYEIAGGLGVKRGAPDREVYVMVGDGSYLMMSSELVTAAAEGIRIIVVLIQNDGYQSIGALSEDRGSQRFGTAFRTLDRDTESFDTGEPVKVDLAANAEGFGATVFRIEPGDTVIEDLRAALEMARHIAGPVVIHLHNDPLLSAPDSQAWWEVVVSEVSDLDSTKKARVEYEKNKADQRPYVG